MNGVFIWAILRGESEPEFKDWWAQDRKEEQMEFEAFIDRVYARWLEYPSLHINHYASLQSDGDAQAWVSEQQSHTEGRRAFARNAAHITLALNRQMKLPKFEVQLVGTSTCTKCVFERLDPHFKIGDGQMEGPVSSNIQCYPTTACEFPSHGLYLVHGESRVLTRMLQSNITDYPTLKCH